MDIVRKISKLSWVFHIVCLVVAALILLSVTLLQTLMIVSKTSFNEQNFICGEVHSDCIVENIMMWSVSSARDMGCLYIVEKNLEAG